MEIQTQNFERLLHEQSRHCENWIDLLPTGANRFDTEGGGFAVEFTRGPTAEITEFKVSGGRVRHLRYIRVTLPPTKRSANNSQP